MSWNHYQLKHCAPPPLWVLGVKVFVELQDELDQWTDLGYHNPWGWGGREKSAQDSPESTISSCHGHRAWSSCLSTREILNPFFKFFKPLSNPSCANGTILNICKNGILETLQSHLYAGHIIYILWTTVRTIFFCLSSLGKKETLS